MYGLRCSLDPVRVARLATLAIRDRGPADLVSRKIDTAA